MSSQSNPRPLLDHIVILVPYQTLFELQERLKDTLVVIEGGEHADGSTVNKLIILPDGVYIELIAFRETLDPAQRKKHRWGSLEEGQIIDWAFTLPHEADFGTVQQRVRDAATQFPSSDPIAGGRVRPDGVVLKWAVAAALDGSGNLVWPGYAPFWCLDRTPRRLRVPYQDEKEDGRVSGLLAHTKHPSGVTGVSHVAVSVPKDDLSSFIAVYDGILKTGQETDGSGQTWHYEVPSGSHDGDLKVTLAALGSEDIKTSIKLVLLGTEDSPKSIEVLPGLTIEITSAN